MPSHACLSGAVRVDGCLTLREPLPAALLNRAAKFWDTRKVPKSFKPSRYRRANAPHPVRVIGGSASATRRNHGISSLALDASGSQLLVNYTNNRWASGAVPVVTR